MTRPPRATGTSWRAGVVAVGFASMSRPIVLGVVGDSGAGKTTLTRGLVRVLGDDDVAHLSADDYHRYDRHERRSLGITPLHPDANTTPGNTPHERRSLGITPLHPDANSLDILPQDLRPLRRGEPILKPV